MAELATVNLKINILDSGTNHSGPLAREARLRCTMGK